MSLITDNPIALNALMTDTLFSADFSVEVSHGFEHVEKKHLQTETPPLTVENPAAKEEFIFQGSIAQGIVFILRYPEYDYFSPGAADAFEKSIGAIGLSTQDVAVVNLANAHNPNDFKRIMAFFKPTKITLLGVDPQSLTLPTIPHNSFMKGKIATVFNTFSFEEMFVDAQKKKAFWIEFKKFLQTP